MTNNCTTFAVRALQAGGISSPTNQHVWTMPENARQQLINVLPWWWNRQKAADKALKDLYGYTPADATQDIKLTRDNYVVNINGNLTQYNTIWGQ